MPGSNDYLNATGAEFESSKICSFLIYLYGKLKKPIQKFWLQMAGQPPVEPPAPTVKCSMCGGEMHPYQSQHNSDYQGDNVCPNCINNLILEPPATTQELPLPPIRQWVETALTAYGSSPAGAVNGVPIYNIPYLDTEAETAPTPGAGILYYGSHDEGGETWEDMRIEKAPNLETYCRFCGVAIEREDPKDNICNFCYPFKELF